MKMFNRRGNKGQSLVEIIVGLAISAILITAAATAIALTLKESLEIKTSQIAASLSQEYLDNVQAMAESDWVYLYDRSNGNSYYLTASGTTYAAVGGSTSTTVLGKTFNRYFVLDKVKRDSCGVGDITENSLIACNMEIGSGYIANDPSTLKITTTIIWDSNHKISQSQYLTRNRNFVFHQTDWSGGSGQESFATTSEGVIMNNKFTSSNNIGFATSGSLFVSSPLASGTLVSSIYESGQTNRLRGTALNSIIWQGQADAQGIKFQIASSDCFNGADDSPNCVLGVGWDYLGPDGTSNTFYNAFSPDDSAQINLAHHNSKRYFRYKIFLIDSDGNLSAPRIDDISINFSP
ncbi:prepilin-type N-terminal cleavage/methylation domain-containing protein [Candidatus Wolfebacteria bacterium]|nr:prepilin-type N-terminal cleavage/methylation domain-containing protein [Candidatus Wolfebacteria bacterium]